jgi:hypothetical protein
MQNKLHHSLTLLILQVEMAFNVSEMEQPLKPHILLCNFSPDYYRIKIFWDDAIII